MIPQHLRYLPLKLFSAYIIFSLSLLVFGPINYVELNPIPVVTYMVFFLVLFGTGYSLGLAKTKTDVKIIKSRAPTDSNKMKTILLLTTTVVLLMACIKGGEVVSVFMSGGNTDFSSIGTAYSEGYEDYERGGTTSYSPAFILKIFTYLPLTIALILGSFYYSRLATITKWGVLLVWISIPLTETLANGKQKQLGDLLIFILILLALKGGIEYKKNLKKIYLKSFVALIGGVVTFATVLKLRYEAVGVSGLNVNDNLHRLMKFDLDHLFFQLGGPMWGFAASVFTGYITQGYYGLSLCLKMPFVWTYGTGNSYASTVLLTKFLGLPLSVEDTYPYRVGEQFGWGQSKWHSAFSWYAGDLTFIGVLFFFAIFGYVYGKLWKEVFLSYNPFSILLFVFLSVGVVFIPANNQLLHSPESTLTLILLFCLWVAFRGKFNFTNKY